MGGQRTLHWQAAFVFTDTFALQDVRCELRNMAQDYNTRTPKSHFLKAVPGQKTRIRHAMLHMCVFLMAAKCIFGTHNFGNANILVAKKCKHAFPLLWNRAIRDGGAA
eukprot:7960723-Alexandrium_andersonii.AAC.1